METALIIAVGAGITAAALLLRKKRKEPITERNVVWWNANVMKSIESVIINSSPSTLNQPL